MTPIILSFRYSKEDVVRAMRAHYSSVLRVKLDGVLAILLLGAGLYCLRVPALRWFGIFGIVASSVLLVMLGCAFTVLPRLAFNWQPKYRDDYSLVFSNDGLHFRTAHIDSQLQWSLYSRVLADAHSYLLYYGKRTFTIIPTRVFQNGEQRTNFEQLLSQNVGRIVRKEGRA